MLIFKMLFSYLDFTEFNLFDSIPFDVFVFRSILLQLDWVYVQGNWYISKLKIKLSTTLSINY